MEPINVAQGIFFLVWKLDSRKCGEREGCQASFTEGLIYLIPKLEKELDEIRQWRSITILNLIHKIFANILVERVKSFLGDIIQTNQTGFMAHRSIMDNVILFWEARLSSRPLSIPLYY